MRTLAMAMALAALLGLGAALVAEEKPAVPTKPADAFGPPKTARWQPVPDFTDEFKGDKLDAGSPEHKRKDHMNVHVFRTPEEPDRPHWHKPTVWEAPDDLADGYRVYALEWDKEKIAWYVDGVLRRTEKNTHWHQPLTLNFDSETMPEWFGLPEEKDLPSTFSIEYIRAWKKVADR
ncbi:MAG TPA: family 16 glycosylhydrolase [Phycisphaerae bacterium]|nr:family 16 glycosylhydrolase [Phycisphaerae bacterium]